MSPINPNRQPHSHALHFSARRTAPRAPIEVEVGYREENERRDRTGNLSGTGVFIRCAEPLPVGTHRQFLLHLPALPQPLLVPGIVRWAVDPGQAVDQASGMGVEFRFRDDHQKHALRRLVDDLIQDQLAEALFECLTSQPDDEDLD